MEDSRHAVSMFSNCGAGDLGFRRAGFEFDVLAEIDGRRLEIAGLNHPGATLVEGDIRVTWPRIVDAFRERFGAERPPDLLAACPPCQGMSSARGDRGPEDDPDAGSRDERNLLVVAISKVAKELRPSIIVVENVPAFLRRKVRHPRTGAGISAARLLVSMLRPHYRAYGLLADLSDYGIPQHRHRAFLVFLRDTVVARGSLEELSLSPFPEPTHGGVGQPSRVTLGRALRKAHLPPLSASSAATAHSADPMHSVPVWDQRRFQMVSAIPPGTGRSAWENEECSTCGPVDVGPGDAICPTCNAPLLRPVVQDGGDWRLIRGFRNSSYRRLSPQMPSSTITTASANCGSDRTLHPFENRVLSPAECALLQTIPSDFAWGDALDRWGMTNVRKMIGEAVPPLFTELHGQVLTRLLDGRTAGLISRDDPRCVGAQRRLDGE